MIFEFSAIVLVLAKISKCSLVVDSFSQNGIYVNDYCPKMPHCAEGAHVMCMYYNPHSVMGPRCHNAQNVTITPDIATKLLDISNAVRSKIALGKEKGKNGEHLPRGYGLFRLIWDNELATFAQVLVNQCVLRHDLCRATKKFSDPGQTAGLVRFSYPDWFPISKSGHFTSPGLSDSKLIYATIQTLKSWYSQKKSVTPDMIVSYPDWTLNPNDQGGRLYLEMIHGSATHMGCGISAYTEFAYYDNHAALNYNSVQIICNFSTRPREGSLVYNITHPAAPGYTVRCGCPPDSDEDEDCLCRENPTIPPSTEKMPTKVCSEYDIDCKDPAVVVLPIFTIEDAPQSKLIKPPKKLNGFPETKATKIKQRRIYTKNNLFNDHNLHKTLNVATLHGHNNGRSSIFTKVQQFHLPILNGSIHSVGDSKEYSNKENNSLSTHESVIKGIHPTYDNQIMIPELHDTQRTIMLPAVSESTLNTAEEKLMTDEHYWKTNLLNNTTPVKVERDDKELKNLLLLLDKLEKEIKNTDLNENEKKLIDAKIRKIYGSVISHENLLSIHNPKTNHYSKVNFQTDIKHYSIENRHDEEFDTDYDLDIEYRPKSNHDTNLRLLDRNTRYDVDNINKEDMSKHRARRNQHANFKTNDQKNYLIQNDTEFNSYNRKKYYYNKESIYNDDFGMDRNKFRDEIEEYGIENDGEFNTDYYEDRARDHRNTNKLDRNRYRDKSRRYDDRTLHDQVELERSRKLHYFYDDDIDTRNKHKAGNSRRRLRNNDPTEYNRRDRFRNTNIEDDEDLLGPERIKYYQDKLDRLQRRVQDRQHYAHNKKRGERPLRFMRSTYDLNTRSKSLDVPYMPGRARFLHGF